MKGFLDTRACEEPSHGSGTDGDIAEYVLATEYALVSLPDGLEFDQAAVLVGAGVSLQTFIQPCCTYLIQATV